MKIIRRKTKVIKIGNVCIGGNNPIAIQSMTKTETADIEKTVEQIKELQELGCEIVRLSVKDNQDAEALKKIKEKVRLPIVADIHFDWRLALAAIDSGADKIRLNPGNIYKKQEIQEIARVAKCKRIPIRVGVNSGSVRGAQKKGSGYKEMTKSALDYIKILENFGFYNIVISLKSSNIFDTIEAYRQIAKRCSYPLHLGVTATGSSYSGAIKSTIALSTLLLEGLGDTIRISLTDEPAWEVRVAKIVLESLGLRHFGPQIISCPSCGRCEVDLIKIVKKIEDSLACSPVSQFPPEADPPLAEAGSTGTLAHRHTGKPIRVAIMGCVVNGPGEAKEADIGLAFGKREGLLFRNGKPIRKVSPDRCVDALLAQVYRFEKRDV